MIIKMMSFGFLRFQRANLIKKLSIKKSNKNKNQQERLLQQMMINLINLPQTYTLEEDCIAGFWLKRAKEALNKISLLSLRLADNILLKIVHIFQQMLFLIILIFLFICSLSIKLIRLSFNFMKLLLGNTSCSMMNFLGILGSNKSKILKIIAQPFNNVDE